MQLHRTGSNGRGTRVVGSWSLVSILAVVGAVGAQMFSLGCQNRKVRVEIQADGEETTRAFSTNETSTKALDEMAKAYGSAPTRDSELGRRFTGIFAENSLPSEMGNRGAIGRLESSLGTARFYYEQFADKRPEWESMKLRVDGGILWMKIFGRFVETRKIKDDATRADFSSWWNSEAIPLVADAYLMYSGMQAATQAQRIGAMPRRAQNHGERTPDETFRLSVFQPFAVLFAERGWLTADELAAIQSVGINGHVSSREGEWLSENILQPAIARILVRFDPSRQEMKLRDFIPLGLEFLLWTRASREYRDLVLESPAIPEATKAEIRAGKWNVELPPPFGFRLLERPKVTDAEVFIATGAAPFFTNGTWNSQMGRVEFKGGFYETKHRYAPYNPPYYAFWALPSQRQESVFREVILQGEPLAQYCAWENALRDEQKAQWLSALDVLASTQDPLPAYAVLAATSGEHPLPRVLATWICERAAKPLPEIYLTQEERDAKIDRGAQSSGSPESNPRRIQRDDA